MARLRILELPPSTGEEHPFVVVIDDTGDGETAERLRNDFDGTGPAVAERLGARCILAFTDPIDLPDDDTPPDPRTPAVVAAVRDVLGIDMAQGPADLFGVVLAACAQVRVLANDREALTERIGWMRASLREALDLPDDEAIDVVAAAREQLDEARNWARHGYEIGQRHCGWSDHGVAPAWLTKGWPPHIESCEHAARAAEYDTALTRMRGLPEAPTAMDPSRPYSAEYLTGYRHAINSAKRVASNRPVDRQDREMDRREALMDEQYHRDREGQ